VVDHNPIAALVEDENGSLDPEVLNEKVISCVLEFIIPGSATGKLMKMVEELSTEVNTVFNVCVGLRTDDKGNSPLDKLFNTDVFRLPNGKVNIGLATGISPERVSS